MTVAFAVSGLPNPDPAGVVQSLTVTAKDPFGNTATGYVGTVHFTSSDPAAVLPGDFVFQSGDAGTHVFSVTLKTAGTRSVTATDTANSSIAGSQSAIRVNPGSAATLSVTGLPNPYVAGAAHNVTVTALDTYGNTATGYTGTVHLSSTDGAASLPGNYTFTGGDAGTHTFSVTLNTVGARSVSATDTVTGTITGSQSGIRVLGATYVPLNPSRILDTRTNNGLAGPSGSHEARTFQVTGNGGVPAGATAVTGNLTVTGQTSPGYLFLGPIATDDPTSSTLNFPVGDDRANAVTVALGAGGALSVTFVAPAPGPIAHVIFDVTGYFVPDSSSATYLALTPARVLDTRDGTGLAGSSGSHAARTFGVSGNGGVPSNAIAVTGNLTVTGQTSPGYLFLGPVATNDPTSSTLNFPVGDDRANGVTVALGDGGTLSVTFVAPAPGPIAHVIFDVTGYFVPNLSGATYIPLNPTRILDTRSNTGLAGPSGSHAARPFAVSGIGGVLSGATAVTGNLTVTGQTSNGYLFLGPVATNDPTSSTLNFPVGDDRANAATVALGSGGTLGVTFVAPAPGPTAHVIFDVTGYFAP
jgi:hypothetical protein